jgi:predicted RNA-binding protein with EMAP domain
LVVGRPISIVDRIDVLQEGHNGVQLLVSEVELRHAAATRDTLFRTALNEGFNAFVAVTNDYVAQFGAK